MKHIARTDTLRYYHLPFFDLAELAQEKAETIRRQQGEKERVVTYHIDRNINYTNRCVSECAFCSFYDNEGGYFLSDEEIRAKTREALSAKAEQILLQGGLNPDAPFSRYTTMLRTLRDTFPTLHIHAFSPPEIAHFAERANMTTRDVLAALIDAGLSSLPGGGGEILVDEVRARVSPGKCDTETWVRIMREAHALGLQSSATMMFGFGERVEDRIAHLTRLKEIQDETGGFVAFIPWTYQQGCRELAASCAQSGEEYLRVLAFSRVYLDSFSNIQASWLTQGLPLAQVALHMGANDMGSVMLEENVVRAAGTTFTTNEAELRRVITNAGFIPMRRNFFYERIPETFSLFS